MGTVLQVWPWKVFEDGGVAIRLPGPFFEGLACLSCTHQLPWGCPVCHDKPWFPTPRTVLKPRAGETLPVLGSPAVLKLNSFVDLLQTQSFPGLPGICALLLPWSWA